MSSKMSHNHYEVMYVEPSCTRDEIHKQYKYLALVWHPDKKRVNLYATVQLQELNETHRVLDNPNKRALKALTVTEPRTRTVEKTVANFPWAVTSSMQSQNRDSKTKKTNKVARGHKKAHAAWEKRNSFDPGSNRFTNIARCSHGCCASEAAAGWKDPPAYQVLKRTEHAKYKVDAIKRLLAISKSGCQLMDEAASRTAGDYDIHAPIVEKYGRVVCSPLVPMLGRIVTGRGYKTLASDTEPDDFDTSNASSSDQQTSYSTDVVSYEGALAQSSVDGIRQNYQLFIE
ncbi:hypothetical protein TruAng_000676 [Truncatella angustata]|nr:hypothetical protein TruAng_000676 [Truncatella angustata]